MAGLDGSHDSTHDGSDDGSDAADPGATRTVAGDETSADRSTDHSGETPENQAQEASQEASSASAQGGFEAALGRRVAVIDALLAEKEALQLGYVRGKVPRPFYMRWREEANDVFALRVTLKRRRRA